MSILAGDLDGLGLGWLGDWDAIGKAGKDLLDGGVGLEEPLVFVRVFWFWDEGPAGWFVLGQFC